MMVRWTCLTALVLVALTVSACSTPNTKTEIVGKWEATITHKATGVPGKVLWEFLPDGTFTVAPLEDATTIVDKAKYQILDEGRSVKINSQIVDYATCIVDGNNMNGETATTLVKFRKL